MLCTFTEDLRDDSNDVSKSMTWSCRILRESVRSEYRTEMIQSIFKCKVRGRWDIEYLVSGLVETKGERGRKVD